MGYNEDDKIINPGQKIIVKSKYTRVPNSNDEIVLELECTNIEDGIAEQRRVIIHGDINAGHIKTGVNINYISGATIYIHLHKKYNNRDCIITYKYGYYSVFIGYDYTINDIKMTIKDGNSHPRLKINKKLPISCEIVKIKYIGKKSFWYNLMACFTKMDTGNITP